MIEISTIAIVGAKAEIIERRKASAGLRENRTGEEKIRLSKHKVDNANV